MTLDNQCEVRDVWSCKICIEDYLDAKYIPKYMANQCYRLRDYIAKIDHTEDTKAYYLIINKEENQR